MLYPFKFKPAYKDYMWGGRNLEKLGKELPPGIKVAESWEVSCHPDGVSTVANGPYEGTPLPELVRKLGRKLIGTSLPERDLAKFPLLVKFIDADNDLSVQVHPDDAYAQAHENGEYGKNEMWYILSAEPGAKLIYDVVPGTTRESFLQALKEERLEECLKYVEVSAGDTINIPVGLVHAIGKGILLAEVQQNSNTTYRVYDYNRVDANGKKRPLHIEKALDVIDFNSAGRREKVEGLRVDLGGNCYKVYKIANRYFSVELCEINGKVEEHADGSRFFIYIFTRGEGVIGYEGGELPVRCGETVLIPAALGRISLEGNFTALKAYVPDIEENVIAPLKKAGCTMEEILDKVDGLK